MGRKKNKKEDEKPAQDAGIENESELSGEEAPIELDADAIGESDDAPPDEEAIEPEEIPDPEPLPVEAEPEPAEEPEELEPLPTIEDIVRAGYTLKASQKILEDLTEERKALLSDRPHYIISCPMPRGYWKIGRHFTKKPQTLYLDELKPEEIVELERAQACHVKVEKIGFPEADDDSEV